MAEKSVLEQGLLSEQEIEEIYKVFLLIDRDGTGYITPENLHSISRSISQNENIQRQLTYQLLIQIDKDGDGKATWDEFLQYVCIWLHSYGFIRSKIRTDVPLEASEKQKIHQALVWLLSLQQPGLAFQPPAADCLEERAETWDYLAGGPDSSEMDKQAYYSAVFPIVAGEQEFPLLVSKISSLDVGISYSALQKIRELLNILSFYNTPADRLNISSYLLKLFNHIIETGCMNNVFQLLNSSSREVQWEALKIITIFAPGPLLPDIPSDYYLHPSHKYTKKLIVDSGCLPKILELCESNCLEIRDQALLAVGFLARHETDIRDHIKSLGFQSNLLNLLRRAAESQLLESSSVIKALWVLSIFSGASTPHSMTPPFPIGDLAPVAELILALISAYNDETCIVNGLICLSYLLPSLVIDTSTRFIMEKILFYLTGSYSHTVKRAGLQAIRNTIWMNASGSQILTELNLSTPITGLLFNGSTSTLKLDVCSILRYLVQKGYSWEIFNVSLLTTHIQYILSHEPDVRWEAVKLLQNILSVSPRPLVEDIANSGLVNSLFSHLICFREVSPLITELYKVSCFTYNFGFLHDCLIALDRILQIGWVNEVAGNLFTNHFSENASAKLLDIVKILAEEVKQGNHDLYQLNHGQVNVISKQLEKSITDLIDKMLAIHSSNQFLSEYLNHTKKYLYMNLRTANYELLTSNSLNIDIIFNCVQNFNIKCMELYGYPNGDNRLITISKQELNFYTLKQRVANSYGYDKKLEYLDEKGDKIGITSQECLQFALYQAVRQDLDMFLHDIKARNQPIPNPIILQNVELRIIVSGNFLPATNYNYQTSEIYSGMTSPGIVRCSQCGKSYIPSRLTPPGTIPRCETCIGVPHMYTRAFNF